MEKSTPPGSYTFKIDIVDKSPLILQHKDMHMQLLLIDSIHWDLKENYLIELRVVRLYCMWRQNVMKIWRWTKG